jgi:hypothetical protein
LLWETCAFTFFLASFSLSLLSATLDRLLHSLQENAYSLRLLESAFPNAEHDPSGAAERPGDSRIPTFVNGEF